MQKEAELCNERVLRFALKRVVTTRDTLPHPKAGSLWLAQSNQEGRIHTSWGVVAEICPFFEDLSGSTWGRRETEVLASHKTLELHKE